MKSGTANQSKIVLKNDKAIQFKPTKNANIFKDFYSGKAKRPCKKVSSRTQQIEAVLHEYKEKLL